MLIGVPKEIKDHEYRVGLTPDSVNEVVLHGHDVIVEHGAGAGIGVDDSEYAEVGATIAERPEMVFERAEMIVKVKEPLAGERAMLREGQILFTYLHLAPDPEQTADLVKSKAVCIAYETVTSPAGGLPLLAPMSEVAGRLAIQAAAHALEKVNGGKGMLLGGVPGVLPAKVVIIGGGVVGTHAAHIAMGMGADTWAIDRSAEALKALWRQFGRPLDTVYSTRTAIERHVTDADVVIGGVLIPGAAAPKLVTADMVRRMKPGSVVVDVAIDQGGCFETSHPTTHSDPTYIVDDVNNGPCRTTASRTCRVRSRVQPRSPTARPSTRWPGERVSVLATRTLLIAAATMLDHSNETSLNGGRESNACSGLAHGG